VDWSVTSGIKMIQLLPVNDTWSRGDWRDSYPYSSISVYALHPIYMDVKQLTTDAEILKNVESKAAELNKLKKIDYEVK
jgi:4-alpha-glucanotransferase